MLLLSRCDNRWWFQTCLFSTPVSVEMIQFDQYCSNGWAVQPPTIDEAGRQLADVKTVNWIISLTCFVEGAKSTVNTSWYVYPCRCTKKRDLPFGRLMKREIDQDQLPKLWRYKLSHQLQLVVVCRNVKVTRCQYGRTPLVG